MSLKTYISAEGQTVYNLAIKLYNSSMGVSNILSLNSSLVPDVSITTGTSIVYDDSVSYVPVTNYILPTNSIRPSFVIRENQSVWDLAINLYGDAQFISKLINVISSDLNSQMPVGVNVLPDYSNNYLVRSIFKSAIVSTFQSNQNLILTETGFAILTETGGSILTEN